jgi:hypothetical protein
MSTPGPAILLWGPDYHVLYNEAYIPIVGAKHPNVFGKPAKEGFADVWIRFMPFLLQCREARRGATFEYVYALIAYGCLLTIARDMQFFLDRGLCEHEETYFNLTISPISEGNDGVTGFFEQIAETTKRKLSERRMSTILELGEKTAKAHDVISFWTNTAAALGNNPYDISFAAIYSVQEGTERQNRYVSN